MKLHPDDHQRALAYQTEALQDFPSLTSEQLERIRQKSREYLVWFRAHPFLHNTASVLLLLSLFTADVLALLGLPSLLSVETGTPRGAALAGVVAGALHGFLVCNIVTLTVHEGAAHDLLIQGRGPVTRALRFLANNACRLFAADPLYYAEAHFTHHRSLGTPEDGSFTNFVRFQRLLGALAPLAPVLSVSDYFPWRPQEHTRSRNLSAVLTTLYMTTLGVLAYWRFGATYTLVALLLVGTWVSYALDRIRESVEHLYMPLDRNDGTRELGPGFWGLLLGGGPWGQSCHLSHHLAPALPWYQQLGLHFFLRRLLTNEQKRHFFLRPFIGFPLLLWGLITGRGPASRVNPHAAGTS
ncbi:fatty acid desaturase [Archangium sp.]|uniref:fatty acid desaturase n=1 Tax=Archangium sp. TaxID=1872627 RepID=UPI002D43093A|nr:fatty acid desaturase [Archangium sp.]HYO56926.1 fatty acid desaturase [Archangium sp.]